MKNIRVISDTHFNHQLLIDIGDRKPWFEIKIYENLLRIPKWDILIHLWDICIGSDKEMHQLYIEPLEDITKILIRGNHDKKTNTWYLDNGRDMVLDSATLNYFGENILFTHIPKPKDWYLNIHWHLHMNKHHEPTEWDCLLYSCEFENYRPVMLKKFIKKHKKTKIDL